MYCRNCRKWFPNNISICDSCGMPLVEDLDIYGENFFYGDAQAFEYIYKESYNWVAGEVSKVLSAGSPEAEGCINTIYNVLYEKIKDYDPGQGSFTAWFAILIQNTIYNYGIVEADSNSKGKGTPTKAALVKVLTGVITVAVIGSGIFVGRRINKQHQEDKKVTTVSKEDTAQKSTQKQKDVKKTEKENNNKKKKDIKNEEKEKQKDTKVSVMDVIDQNKPFVEEILEMEAGYSFPQENREDNFKNIMLRSLNRLYGNEVEEGQTTNIWDVVPKENVKQCEYQEGGGKISVKESGFERMREFLGCTETITNLCANDYDTFSCVDGIVREDSAQPVGEETLRIDQIVYKPLSNGDVQAFYICNQGSGVEEINTAIITQADNTMGIQLKSCDIIAFREYDILKIFGSIAALGKEYKNDGKFVNIEQMSEEKKEAALIFSVYWQCVSKDDDVNAWEFGAYYPIFDKDEAIVDDDLTVTLPHDAFDDYLEFVDYNGTIDDMIDNNDFKYEYGCSISRSGGELTFTYDEDYDIVCTLQLTEEAGYNWDGFELEENGDLKVTCLLYDESEKSSGIGYTATIKFTDNAFGMQLESLEKES